MNDVRIAPQLLGNVSYYFENLPSNWGTFRTTSKASPAAGERFVLLRKPPQLLGNASYCFESLPSCWGAFPTPGIFPQLLGSVSSSGIPSPVAGERFQLRDSFPSRWGAFPASGILPQPLGSVSSFGNPSPAAGERFQLQESFPSSSPSIARAISKSTGVVSLIFSRLPSTSETGCPAASTTEASSVKNGV